MTNSQWWTGSHLDFLKIWGCIKQALLIKPIMISNPIFELQNKSRHSQLHTNLFGFLISQFLTKLMAFFLFVFLTRLILIRSWWNFAQKLNMTPQLFLQTLTNDKLEMRTGSHFEFQKYASNLSNYDFKWCI